VERDGELAALERTLAGARDGAGGVAVIEGPAGIGKTELLDYARAAAAEGGFAIAFARCGALERGFVFGVARQLFEARVRELSARADERALAGPAALAIPALGLQPPAAGEVGGDPAFAAVHGLLWLCMGLQDERALLIAVDDAQWSDELSARFLAYLGARVEGTRIALVLTVRRAPESDLPAGVAQLLADPRTVALRPAPLSEIGSGRVLSDVLGEAPDAALAAECHRATGGSPFLLRALAYALAHDGAPAADARVSSVAGLVPSSVARVVVMRLNGVSGDALSLARAAAALDAEAPLGQVAQVAGLDPAAAASALDELVRAEVLAAERPVRFLHPLIGDAVRAELPPGEAARLQTRAAAVLHAHGVSAGRVGAHLLASGVVGEQWAVELLDRAAHEALEQGAPETAADLWRRALEERNALAAGLASDDQAPVELLLGLGRAEVRAQRREGLQHLHAALARCPPGSSLRATAARELGRALIHFGNARETVALLDATLQESGDDSDALVELESALLTALRMDASLATELPERMPRSVARSERGDAAARLLLAQRAV
jgi:AAA ATPase domain